MISGIPPSYSDIWELESRLPQHNLSVYSPGTRRYLHISGHLVGHGFNNVLTQALLLSHLAYKANRSYVFDDYIWSTNPLPWTIYDLALRPSRMPLNAFISGPTAGMPAHDTPAVSERFWETVCPQSRRKIISGDASIVGKDTLAVFNWWLDTLARVEDECVDIENVQIDGQAGMNEIWESYSSSLVLRDFSWSFLVRSAVTRNHPTLGLPISRTPHAPVGSVNNSGLIAVHLRRGDYKRHCPRLSTWNSGYISINRYPSLPDRFDPSQFEDSPQLREAYYITHCLPTVEEIVKRMREVRRANPHLKRVYVSTNAWWWFVNSLKSALLKDGWEGFMSSLDIVLDSEQQFVSMAVDMAIAEQADVLLGNGFSSLTANIIMLRLARGMDPASNRFL